MPRTDGSLKLPRRKFFGYVKAAVFHATNTRRSCNDIIWEAPAAEVREAEAIARQALALEQRLRRMERRHHRK